MSEEGWESVWQEGSLGFNTNLLGLKEMNICLTLNACNLLTRLAGVLVIRKTALNVSNVKDNYVIVQKGKIKETREPSCSPIEAS